MPCKCPKCCPQQPEPIRPAQLREAWAVLMDVAKRATPGSSLARESMLDYLLVEFPPPVAIRTVALLTTMVRCRRQSLAPTQGAADAALRRAAVEPLDPESGAFLSPSFVFDGIC